MLTVLFATRYLLIRIIVEVVLQVLTYLGFEVGPESESFRTYNTGYEDSLPCQTE
jgi:hypothetical protein